MQKNNLINLLLPLLAFTLPLFFLPTTLNFFATNKQALIITVALILVLGMAFQIIKSKSLPLLRNPLLYPIFLLTLSTLLTTALIKEGQAEAVVNRGSLILALSLVALFTALSTKPKQLARRTLSAIILSGTILALHGVLQLTALSTFTSLPSWMQAKSFTPAGSPLILLTFLVPSLAATGALLLKKSDSVSKTVLLVAGVVQLSAFVSYLSLSLPGKIFSPQLLPASAGWSLALDALKSGRSLILGVGLSNFPSLFTSVKPLLINQTDIWPIVQQTSSNELFHILTTTGILGFASFLLLALVALKSARALSPSPESHALYSTLIASLLTFLLIPANIISYFVFFVVIGLIAAQKENKEITTVKLAGNLGLTLAVILISSVVFLGYNSYKVYAAETSMRRAQLALASGDAQSLYDSHLRAIALFPNMTSYHLSFSQINMSLAASLSDRESATDAEREQITLLVQRAVEAGRTAARLRPNNFLTWQNLGQIYRNLINVANGADNFAVQYYGQSVNLNPASPTLRVDYGGLFYQLALVSEDPTNRTSLLNQAVREFQIAIQLRPNYANAHFNLAKALEASGNLQVAVTSMQKVLEFLSPESPDYAVAQNELTSLQSKLPKGTQTGEAEVTTPSGTDLSEPGDLPSPLPGGPIDLPEEEPLPTPSPDLEE